MLNELTDVVYKETKTLLEQGTLKQAELTAETLMVAVEQSLARPEFVKLSQELKVKACREAVRDILEQSDSGSHSKDSKRAKKSKY
jgi:hypothetical protein